MKNLSFAILLAATSAAFADNTGPLPAPSRKAPAPAVPQVFTNPVPVLVFPTNIFDFGKQAIGTVIRGEFTFTNAGTARLEITGVETTCDCTTIPRWTRIVEPGGTGAISFEVRRQASPGSIRPQTIVVHSNDPRQPEALLEIKGEMWKLADFQPAAVQFEFPAGQETNLSRVRITSFFANRLSIVGAESDHKAFRAEVRTNIQDRDFEVIVHARGPFAPGTHRGVVTLTTTSPDLPVIEIPITAVVKGGLVVEPSEISVPADMQTGKRARIYLRNRLADRVSVKSAKATLSSIQVDVEEVQPGRLFYVTAQLPAGLKLTSDQKAEVVIATTSPEFPELRVPVVQRGITVMRAEGTPAK